AFSARAVSLETNVARVLYRIFVARRRRAGSASKAVDGSVGSEGSRLKTHAMKKHLWAMSEAVLPFKHMFDFNPALMDFGALHCSARKPQCPGCPMMRF